ncbi:hypothetical protein [Mycobacterium sp. RTGN5]|uniref:hypothetical protein n=1 Tax=Mycobacterium sp. RTGN5 TaxID=3016522 RepID=UPI0029C91F1E|nr:hypothetical protein [Mycobacterium sp. RTGN5]
MPDELFLGDDAEQLRLLPAVQREARDVEAAILVDGKAPDSITDLPDDGTRDAIALGRLIGLDLILRRVHPNAGAPPPPELQELAFTYARRGYFNSTTDSGLLLPRLMAYGAPDHLEYKGDLFSVVRVEPHKMKRVRFSFIGSRGWPTVKGKDDIVVACVPFLDTIDDVSLKRVEKFGGGRYQLGPKGAHLKRRIDEVIGELDRSGATIGVIPEGALSETLLTQWKQQLAKTPATPGSRMSLIIIGTGPVTGDKPARNRAVVLDRTGESLWEQDKLCDYTLTRSTIDFWELPNLGDDGDLKEDIHRGSQLFVAETTFGRIAILICEDLQRSHTRDVVPRHLGVSHIFTPVFDRLLESGRWHKGAAEPHLNYTGSRVVVANSRVVGNLMGKKSPMSTALALSPPPGDRGYVEEIAASNSAVDAVCVTMAALGPPP